MQQFRLIIAIALSFLVFLLWDFFVADKQVKNSKENLQATRTLTTKEASPELADQTTITRKKEGLADERMRQPEKTSRIITVTSPFYSVKISEKGAVFNSFVLKNYRETVDVESNLKELLPIEKLKSQGSIGLAFSGDSIPGLENAFFSADIESDSIDVYSQDKKVSFYWESPRGIIVEKRFIFSSETYMIGLEIIVKNGSDQTIKDDLILSLLNSVSDGASRYGFEGPSALIDNKLEKVKIKKIEEKNIYNGKLKWISVQEQYFISSIIPKNVRQASMRLFLKENDILETQYVDSPVNIMPGTQQVYEYNLFMGPKSLKILKGLNCDLDKAINFGFFDFIAKPCLWLMNFLYGFIPNYGAAIIILTILIKILFWPLGTKSYKSMNEMKRVQPLMAEIREKYKHDKKKMNEEIMGLYKVYKINPLGGCLPMVAQIPVFFAFYQMLYGAIELRHAPFFLWINDLSAPDRLFSFDLAIPFMQAPYGIPVLTIIMGATMFIQQKLSPAPGDPSQAKMMMLMPIVFTVIFINFSSGLVLYWLVNNTLSIAQQYYTTKRTA
ncbi:MAG: membrane protein insertase YidC [Deltaproteobacteria bacterium]|nr:membrane protein insertase YidC [Deltaproteobacteria bacterium]